METQMKLTPEQQEILNGAHGETMAKVMQTLVRYGELFGADEMVPVTSRYNHLVTSFGLKALGPVYHLMEQLLEAGAVSAQKFSADPRPLDKTSRAASCRTSCSTTSCIPVRITMSSSSKSWA